MSPKINKTVLMSGAEYFGDAFAINALMDPTVSVNLPQAIQEHQSILSTLETAGVTVIKVEPPAGCQDGVYTANWGLCRSGHCVLSSLPNMRQDEEPYAELTINKLIQKTTKAPYRFSGQGDALPCGNLLFCGSHYRTDVRMHAFLEKELGYKVIGLQTIPKLDVYDRAVINPITGWPDSCFYDLDLALAVITPDLIAWCPEAFVPTSQERINSLAINKIRVSFDEASKGFACNLVSTGETVVMSAHAPQFRTALETQGFKTITSTGTELSKGGGYIRCITLTLDNN
jgi:N-dimethylarginine dimethylaminohydrolase